MHLVERLQKIGALRAAWNENAWPISVSDPRVKALKVELTAVGCELENLLRSEFWAVQQMACSVGQGRTAKVPWISLLAANQKPSEGVTVGLSIDLLGRGFVLGMAKSATIVPDVPVKTLTRTPLSENALDIGPYNDLFVNPREFLFEELEEAAFLVHLRESLVCYQEFLAEDGSAPITVTKTPRVSKIRELWTDENSSSPTEPLLELSGLIAALKTDLAAGHLLFDAAFLLRFVASLLAKPFVLLAGLSGSGKTQLATALARWLGAERCVIAVGADWNSSDRLLGYSDALDASRYVRTPALDLLLKAISNPTRPHFLILDELNLSPPERYLSEILSALESGEPLSLHGEGRAMSGVPGQLLLPSNLFLIGTLNTDETTHALSPKVLDRAMLLDFDGNSLSLAEFLKNALPRPDTARFSGRGSGFAASWLAAARSELVLAPVEHAALAGQLEILHAAVPFGYRTAREILRFAAAHQQLLGIFDAELILDAAIVQKLLPRLFGTTRRVQTQLNGLSSLATSHHWPRTETRLAQLQVLLEANGYVGFGEH
jgi:5-methylcytosine-specific restriction enzyme B